MLRTGRVGATYACHPPLASASRRPTRRVPRRAQSRHRRSLVAAPSPPHSSLPWQVCAKKEDYDHLLGVIEAGWGNFDAFNAIVRNALKLRGRTSCAKKAWNAVEQPVPPKRLRREQWQSFHFFGGHSRRGEHGAPGKSRALSHGHIPKMAILVKKVKSLALMPLGVSRLTRATRGRRTEDHEARAAAPTSPPPQECPPPARVSDGRACRAAPSLGAEGHVRV